MAATAMAVAIASDRSLWARSWAFAVASMPITPDISAVAARQNAVFDMRVLPPEIEPCGCSGLEMREAASRREAPELRNDERYNILSRQGNRQNRTARDRPECRHSSAGADSLGGKRAARVELARSDRPARA